MTGASCLALVMAGQAIAQTAADHQTPTQASDTNGSTSLSEVIVTASRRNENITKVPTAVSAFNGNTLRDAQITSLSDLAALTPNVQINTYLTNADINIRGIGNGNFIQAGGDPGVAVHANGVYLGQSALALSTFLDVERVEVLRGPQGTLFGRNATGGAVNIIPNGPTKELAYGFDVAVGADPTAVRSSAYVSGSLDSAGVWRGRLAVEQNYNEGYSRNLVAGGPSRLDDNDDGAVRAQLEWRPSDTFDARLLFEYARDHDNGPAAYLSGSPTPGPIVFPIPGSPITLPPGFPMGDPSRRQAYADQGDRSLNYKTVDLTFDWGLGGGNLKGTFSYNDSDNSVTQDGDGTSINFTSSAFTNSAKQEYGELLYASNPDRRFDYVVGANVYREELRQNVTVFTFTFPGFLDGGEVDTTSYAVFGHGEFKLTDQARIFGGLRYTHDEKTDNEFNNFAGSAVGDRDFSRVTYEAGLSYDFTRRVTGYFKYATGYKSGGFSVGSLSPGFNPETNDNYEVGLKGNYLDGALRANLAAFHIDYDNLQITQVIGVSSVVTNAAQASIDGVEIESTLHPLPHVRIEATGAWLKARFDRFVTGDSARPQLGVLNLEGNTLPNAPDFNASVGAYYDFDVPSGVLTLGGRFDWKDRIYFSEFNTPISAQGAVGKLDLSLNYKSSDQRWTASLFARNATDEQVKANVTVVSALLGSLALAQYQPGRQVGASIGYHF